MIAVSGRPRVYRLLPTLILSLAAAMADLAQAWVLDTEASQASACSLHARKLLPATSTPCPRSGATIYVMLCFCLTWIYLFTSPTQA